MKITYYTPNGEYVGDLARFSQVEIAYAERAVGYLKVSLPVTDFLLSDFLLDGVLEVYRSIHGVNALDAERGYIIRDFQQTKDTLTLIGYDGNYLLDGRDVIYTDLTATAPMTGYADDLLKQLVTDQIVSPTDADRDIALVSVTPNRSVGETIAVDNPGEPIPLMQALNTICGISYALGTYLTYDVVYRGAG